MTQKITPTNIRGTIADDKIIVRDTESNFRPAVQSDIVALGFTPGGGSAVSLIQSFTAGENISAGDHVSKGTDTFGYNVNNGAIKTYNRTSGGSTTINYGQAFNLAVNTQIVQFTPLLTLDNLSAVHGCSYSLTARIYNITGTYGSTAVKTGSALHSSNTISGTVSGITSYSGFTFDFGASGLSAGDYIVMIEGTITAVGSSTSANLYFYGDTTGAYSGNAADNTTPVAGADMLFNFIYISTTIVVKSQANDITKIDYIGKSTQTVTTGNAILIQTRGSITETGVAHGDTLFLSNTPGAAATTAGTNIVIIGNGTGTNTATIRGLSDLNNSQYTGVPVNNLSGASGQSTPFFSAGGGLLIYNITAWTGDDRTIGVQIKSDFDLGYTTISFEVSPFSSIQSASIRRIVIEPNKFVRFAYSTSSSGSATLVASFIPF